MAKPNRAHILQVIANNPIERNYFFRKLASTENPSEWLVDLKNYGYLDPGKNPRPVEVGKGGFNIPHWEVLDFLVNVAEKNQNKPDIIITEQLQNFIESIIDFNESIEYIDNYRTDWMLIKIIFSLPYQSIKEKYIVFISTALRTQWDNSLIVEELQNKAIPLLLENSPNSHKYLLLIMDYIWRYKKGGNNRLSDDYNSIIPDYSLQELMDKYRAIIASTLKDDGVELAEKIIKEILSQDDSQFNLIWITHIKEDSQNQFLERYEIQLIFFIRDCLLASSSNLLNTKIKDYLKDEHPIFKRLGIFIIDIKYNELKNIFWEIGDNPLEYLDIRNELYPFFQNHANEFNKEEMERIISWIENENYSYLDKNKETEEEKNKYIYYKKKEWLSALINSNNSLINDLYAKYNSLNNAPLYHPGLEYWTGSFSFSDETDVATSSLFDKNNDEIVLELLRQPIDNKKLNYPSMDNYGRLLRSNILRNPKKYWDNLKPFEKVNLLYQHEILMAFLEMWRNKKDLEWKPIFEYIEVLIKNIDYKVKYNEDEFDYRNWVIGAIAELIEEGTRTDSHSFDPMFLPKAKHILLYLEPNTFPESPLTTKSNISILNSARGKVYSALFSYSLRFARLFKQDDENRFDSDILNLCDERLSEKKIEEYFYTLGKYLPFILYLNKKWMHKNINKIFPKKDEKLWQSAMNGYLFYSTRPYEDIYKLLKRNNHLLKAFETSFIDKQMNTIVIQQICVVYLNKWEKLTNKNSLMMKVLIKGDFNQLKDLIQFIWAQKEYVDERSLLEDINTLLPLLYNSIDSIPDIKSKNELKSDLNKWIVYITKFDKESYKIFLDIAKYSPHHYNTIKLVEGLSKIVDSSPEEVADILINAIKSEERIPYYKENVLLKIFDTLKKEKLESKIINICSMLIQKGLYNYKEIQAKYLVKENDENVQ
jgi:hypothetical protein